ncbi:hypothetical protein B6259_07840 [Ruminococcaceae bacterium CPB6]|nr:hypothetical protein B6259_07840 [Ruminococcaceae bacterium CPB6]
MGKKEQRPFNRFLFRGCRKTDRKAVVFCTRFARQVLCRCYFLRPFFSPPKIIYQQDTVPENNCPKSKNPIRAPKAPVWEKLLFPHRCLSFSFTGR